MTLPPSDSWMAAPPSPAPAEPDAAIPPQGAAEETAWTWSTPGDGLPGDTIWPAAAADTRAEPADDAPAGPAAAFDTAEPEDAHSPRPQERSADLSRVELFRSALEELAQTPAEGVASHEAQTDEPADGDRAEERPARALPDDEHPAEQSPARDELSADRSPTGEVPVHEPPDDEPLADRSPTGEVPVHEPPDDEPLADRSPTGEVPVHEPPDDELSADRSPTGEVPAHVPPGDERRRPPTPGGSHGDASPGLRSIFEPLSAHPHRGPASDEVPDDDEAFTRDLAAPQPAETPVPPALAGSDPDEVDTSLPPSVARPGFGRAPAQRLAEALAQGEGPERRDDDEPLRGTVAPVLRRSTERVRHPTSTTPVIRPPVMPPPPAEGAPVPARQRTVSWEQALAGEVLPQGKKKRRQGRRSSKARHESGGVGEYRPKVVADRSLTLLVIAMLVVLAALVAAAVWTFWPRASGATGSLPVLGAPRSVGGP